MTLLPWRCRVNTQGVAVRYDLQTAIILAGHWVAAVALLFALLGMGISLGVGLLWARQEVRGYGDGARGGAIVGGTCALILDSSGRMIGTLDAPTALDII